MIVVAIPSPAQAMGGQGPIMMNCQGFDNATRDAFLLACCQVPEMSMISNEPECRGKAHVGQCKVYVVVSNGFLCVDVRYSGVNPFGGPVCARGDCYDDRSDCESQAPY